MDIMTIIGMTFGGVMIILIGFFFGKVSDIYFRVKLMRSLFKKNYGIVNDVSKDEKSMKSFMANLEEDRIVNGGNTWMFDKRNVYIYDKIERGFHLTDIAIKWHDGVPCVFVGHDTMRTLDFYPPAGGTKPDEMSAWMASWVSNAMAKAGKVIENYKMYLLLTMLFTILVGGLVYINYTTISAMRTELAELSLRIPIFEEDTTLIIKPNLTPVVTPTPVG